MANLIHPIISADNLKCPSAEGVTTKNLNLTILSNNVETTNQKVKDLVTKNSGTLTQESFNTSSSNIDESGKEIPVADTASIDATLPPANADSFISDIKKLVTSPDSIENFSISNQSGTKAIDNCKYNLSDIASLQSQEKSYLLQLSQSNDSYTSQSIIDKVTEIRKQAENYKLDIKNLPEKLNKLIISIYIQESLEK